MTSEGAKQPRCQFKCQACGHTLTLEGYDVVRAIETLPLKELEPRLKCSDCGAKDVQMMILHPPAKR